VTSQTPVIDHRAERVLAYMVAGIIGASIIAFFAVMIGTLANQGTPHWAEEGLWPFVLIFPLIGLPIGFLLLVALLIVNGIRRSRESRRGSA